MFEATKRRDEGIRDKAFTLSGWAHRIAGISPDRGEYLDAWTFPGSPSGVSAQSQMRQSFGNAPAGSVAIVEEDHHADA